MATRDRRSEEPSADSGASRTSRPAAGWRAGVALLTAAVLGVCAALWLTSRAEEPVTTAVLQDTGGVPARQDAASRSQARLEPVDDVSDGPDSAAADPPVQKGQLFHAYVQPGQEFEMDPQLLARLRRVQAAERRKRAEINFRIASFNVLGASHTDGGKARLHSGARMSLTVGLIRDSGVDVAGLQEFQTPQARQFLGSLGGWQAYPGPNGSSREVQNSIAWDTAKWTLVESHTMDIPYFHGKPMPMPYVLLEDAETGRRVWFLNVHNPADVRGPAGKWRAAAIGKETALVRDLTADGTPVLFTGDLNDRAEAYCGVTGNAPMHAALGGDNSGGCHPPGRMDVDWIFGTSTVEFSGYTRWDDGNVDRASDHPLLFTDVTVPGLED